jgi:hypothetical protein
MERKTDRAEEQGMMKYRVKTIQPIEGEPDRVTVWAEVANMDLAETVRNHIDDAIARQNEYVYDSTTPQVVIVRVDETETVVE